MLNCHAQQKSDVTIFKNSALELISKNSKIEVLGDSFIVAEGPLWDSKNNRLLFTDVRQNKLFSWSENGGVKEYISPSGSTGYAPSFSDGGIGANGIAFDGNGNLLLCQHGDRRIAVISNVKTQNPKFKTIIDNFNGKRFNSPNDLSISIGGDIYFTDPPYGFKNFSDKYREIDFNGVYKFSSDGIIKVISKFFIISLLFLLNLIFLLIYELFSASVDIILSFLIAICVDSLFQTFLIISDVNKF